MKKTIIIMSSFIFMLLVSFIVIVSFSFGLESQYDKSFYGGMKIKYNRLKELYYSTGYNMLDLYKYKNNGTLSKKLNKDYTENEIKIIENILEEKAKVLTKKLDNNF